MTNWQNVVVICTKGRRALVNRLLVNISQQQLQPDLVLVVNGVPEPSNSQIESGFEPSGLNLKVLNSTASLPLQRNLALQDVGNSAEFIHFFDDDVWLEPSYLQKIVEEFNANPQIVGATGDITNAHPKRANIIERLFFLKSNKGGVVLKSGVNIGLPGQQVSRRVMWLPGCAMSYRVSAIGLSKFDERRIGYALGEDVDFSARLGLKGELAYVPDAKLEHRFAPRDRVDSVALARDDVINRWLLAETLPFVQKGAVAYSTIGHCLLYFVSSFSPKNSWRRQAATERLKQLRQLASGAFLD